MRLALMLLPLLSLAFAGCSGGETEYETPEQDEQGRYIIRMLSSNRFAPEHAAVPVGATVVWVNEGGSHNTVSDGLWASDVSDDPENFVHTFSEAGTFGYHCAPHLGLGMKGSIRVGSG